MDKSLIRNFSIIAHIDHGKSTLADRILEFTGAVRKREFREQLLDDMDLEREHGITIKASMVRLKYKANDQKEYTLNLIDTPGHVDFTYEVSKSLAACEGAILLIDAAQGVEAQTVANFHLAREQNLVIIPVINKIDLANADIERTKKQIINILRLKEGDIILASAKEGIGTKEILESIVEKIPSPGGDINLPLQALIFDSSFDTYKGAIVYLRVVNGKISAEIKIRTMQTQKNYTVEDIGVLKPHPLEVKELSSGEVGYITAGIRDPSDILIGDTITEEKRPTSQPLAGYRKLKPLVFCGIYPQNAKDFSLLKEAMEKLKLSDASFVYEPESSVSFGYGFRSGFLGLLHMEITQERLEREYNLNLILTTPSVVYRIIKKDGGVLEVGNPSELPSPLEIQQIEEPYIKAFILIPFEDLSQMIELAKSRRGQYIRSEYLSQDRVKLIFSMPLAEIIVDFYDKIKSLTRGYGSLDYEFEGYRTAKIKKLDILINGKICDAFSFLVHEDKVYLKARKLLKKLKDLIPRQLFEVVIQASIGSKIIASEKVRPLGKHVTGKCYGGDITRKRKLWEKQKMGKKRMKRFGKVQIPQEAFLAILKI